MDLYATLHTYVLSTFSNNQSQYVSAYQFHLNSIPLYLMYEGMDVARTLGHVLRDLENDGYVAKLDIGDCLYYRKLDLN